MENLIEGLSNRCEHVEEKMHEDKDKSLRLFSLKIIMQNEWSEITEPQRPCDIVKHASICTMKLQIGVGRKGRKNI